MRLLSYHGGMCQNLYSNRLLNYWPGLVPWGREERRREEKGCGKGEEGEVGSGREKQKRMGKGKEKEVGRVEEGGHVL